MAKTIKIKTLIPNLFFNIFEKYKNVCKNKIKKSWDNNLLNLIYVLLF